MAGINYTKEDLDSFIRMYGKIESRVEEIAQKLKLYYPSSSSITGFSILYGKCIITTKYDDTSDYDMHEFDVKFLAMSDEEIDVEVAKRKAERLRLQEEHERAEFERLRTKYETH